MACDLVPEIGARFTFTSEAVGTWDGTVHCRIHDLLEPELISFTWNANDVDAETLVTFRLVEEGGGTQLTLTHTRFEGSRPGAEGRHAAGWTSKLKELRTALCGPEPGHDWSEIHITFFVEAPVADVFPMWGTAGGMQRFWPDEIICTTPEGRTRAVDETFANGDRLALTFPTGSSTELEILNIEQDKLVTFRFGEVYGWVTVRLAEEGGRTRVELRQLGSPAEGEAPWEIHANARGWWIHALVNLKAALLHDKDLRVREPGAENCLGALFLPGNVEAAKPHDWTAFEIFLYINAPREEISERWSCAAGLESFFVRDACFIGAQGRERAKDEPARPGDRYLWRSFHDFEMKGRVIEASADRFGFTFGEAYEVEITAKAHGGGTLLQLHQRGMRDDPEDRVAGTLNCRSCWIYFLETLKSQLEHGIDLRDQNPATADSVSVGSNRQFRR
jgi:uncharacterized protein YndB with AHSA1/START domain